jgi:hypothetical protein
VTAGDLTPRAASMTTLPDSNPQRVVRRAEAVLTILFVSIAVASQIWQPFFLGFYHDDWYVFVQPRLHAQDFHFLGSWDQDRPGNAIFNKLIIELWDGNPTTLHLVKIAINLLAAAAIGWTVVVYQKALGASSIALAAAAAALWLAAPWGLGYSLWPTGAFFNIAVLFLCVSAICLARWIDRRRGLSLVITTVAFGASVLFYQSTWLAIFPFLLMLGLREFRRGRALWPAAVALACLAPVQAAAALLSFFWSVKTPNPHLLKLFVLNLWQTTRLGLDQFGPLGNYLMVAAAVVAIAAAAVVLWSRGGESRTRMICGMLLVVSGIVATSAVYASAHYGFDSVGVMSRTTQMVDFWLAVGGAILFAPAPSDHLRDKIRLIGLCLFLPVIGAFAASYWPAARPWVRSWQMQQAVLDKSEPLAVRLRDGDVVWSDVPTKVDGVQVFAAPWDITPAVLVRNADKIPLLAHRFQSIQIIPPTFLEMSWTPGTFTLGPDTVFTAKRLLVWHWRTGVVSTVDHPIANRAEMYRLLDLQ